MRNMQLLCFESDVRIVTPQCSNSRQIGLVNVNRNFVTFTSFMLLCLHESLDKMWCCSSPVAVSV